MARVYTRAKKLKFNTKGNVLHVCKILHDEFGVDWRVSKEMTPYVAKAVWQAYEDAIWNHLTGGASWGERYYMLKDLNGFRDTLTTLEDVMNLRKIVKQAFSERINEGAKYKIIIYLRDEKLASFKAQIESELPGFRFTKHE